MIDVDQRGISPASLSAFLRLAQQKVGLSGEVNVRITSDHEIRRLNREFRSQDQPTDVLSFPAGSAVGKARVAGDIAISAEIARANAEALGHSLESELKVLLLHGLLHLAGHDHEADQGQMAALEQKLRAKLRLPASLIERTKQNHVNPSGDDRRGVKRRAKNSARRSS